MPLSTLALLALAAPAAAGDLPPLQPAPPPATAAALPGLSPGGCGPVAEACPTLCQPAGCPPARGWVSAEWLYWATSGNPLPPLVTGSPAGTPVAAAGVLGVGSTATLAGGQRADGDFRSGLRLNGGAWFGDCGVYGDFLFLGRQGSTDTFGSATGSAVVGRPFFNPLTGGQDAELVSFPGTLAGFVTVDSRTDVIGGGGGLMANLCCTCAGRVDLSVGYRYLGVTDELTVGENLTPLDPATGAAAGTILVRDRFRAENSFHGPSVGVYGERRVGRGFVAGWSSLAMGVSHQELTVDGGTVIAPNAGPVVSGPGGLLTAPSNIGTVTRDRFAVVPEVGARLGVQVTPTLRAFVGYTFIYLSSVTRSGDMVDPRVNPNQLVPAALPLVGPAVPAFAPRATDFWMQGVSVGAQLVF